MSELLEFSIMSLSLEFIADMFLNIFFRIFDLII
jgi:hypothetical protein